MAYDDPISDAQIRLVWALKSKLGFAPDVDNIKDIDRRKAKILIDGLLEEVEKLQSDEN